MNLFDLKQAANDGVPEAEFLIGVFYQNGLVFQPDKEKAVMWYSRAAKKGFAAAQYSLASIKSDGLADGDAGGHSTSFKLFLAAAGKGFWPAQDAVAGAIELGYGVKPNPRKAFLRAKSTADEGYTQAEVRVASMYQQGRGTPVNPKQAIYYYKRAAKRGHGLAAYSIAGIYKEKPSSKRNNTQILAWLHRSAELNYINAHFELHRVYSKGLYGQSIDAKKAERHKMRALELTESLTLDHLTGWDDTV
ncbi:MAG: sel1 repeat family protein [Micavibrio sp.]|nr:MAG: sel1 repeat family protein [Micavibrio sp.]